MRILSHGARRRPVEWAGSLGDRARADGRATGTGAGRSDGAGSEPVGSVVPFVGLVPRTGMVRCEGAPAGWRPAARVCAVAGRRRIGVEDVRRNISPLSWY